jgi:hypothetical protein
MKFSGIIKNNFWPSVELVFLQLYPDEKHRISAYEKVFDDLKFLESTDTETSIVISWVKDDFDNKEYVDVSGCERSHTQLQNEQNHSLALEFTGWDKWLGMDVDEKTLQDFTELEIISHCLYEMTFISFDQEIIQEEIDKLEKLADEIRNMSEEEKKVKLKSWDELKNELNWDDKIEE